MSVQLNALRERAEELLRTQPAEVTPEATWLVGELAKLKDVVLALIDHLMTASPEEHGRRGP